MLTRAKRVKAHGEIFSSRSSRDPLAKSPPKIPREKAARRNNNHAHAPTKTNGLLALVTPHSHSSAKLIA
jgi:hypothetical protein